MRAGKPVPGARPWGAADFNRPRLRVFSPRTPVVTPSAPTPLDPKQNARVALASPVRPAPTGTQQAKSRPQEPGTPASSSSSVHIDEDLRARITKAFGFPSSKRFGAHHGDKAKGTERRQPAPEKGVRSPRNAVQSIKADAGRAQKPPGDEKVEQAKSMVIKPAVQEKAKKVTPVVNISPVQKNAGKPKPTATRLPVEKQAEKTKPAVPRLPVEKQAEKTKPTVTRLPVQKQAEKTKPTATKPPVCATQRAKIEPKLDDNARKKNVVAAAKAAATTNKASAKSKSTSKTVKKPDAKPAAAPRPPLKRKQAEANLRVEEPSSESESTIEEDSREDNSVFVRATQRPRIEPKLDVNARAKNAVAAAKTTAATSKASAKSKSTSKTVKKPDAKPAAAPRPPLKRKQAEANLQVEEPSSESESSIEEDDSPADNYVFRRAATSGRAVLDKFQAYARQANYVQPYYPTIVASTYQAPPPPGPATTGFSSSTPGSVAGYWSGVTSKYPTAIESPEDDEDDFEERNLLWMWDTENLPQPPSEDDSIDRRMMMALASTCVLVAALTFVLMSVLLVSRFLLAGADDVITTSAPSQQQYGLRTAH